MAAQMDIESFKVYCKKYNISAGEQKAILAAMTQQKPKLEQGEIEHSWQKEGEWAFNIVCAGKQVKIVLGNLPDFNNVTFIGFEGRNMQPHKLTR